MRKSRNGGNQRTSTAYKSTLKSPPDEEVTFIQTAFSTERSTRSKQVVLPKNDPEEIREGYRNCPECGRGVFSRYGCNTVTCRQTALHTSKQWLRFCIFCKKKCLKQEDMVKCTCPYFNIQENRDRYQDELDARNKEARNHPVLLDGVKVEYEEKWNSMINENEEGQTNFPSSHQSLEDQEYRHRNKRNRKTGSDDDSWHQSESSSYESSDKDEGGSSWDGGTTSESTATSVLPDKVKSSISTINMEEDEVPTDDERYNVGPSKKQIKFEHQPTDDEGMVDIISSSATRLPIKEEYNMKAKIDDETGTY